MPEAGREPPSAGGPLLSIVIPTHRRPCSLRRLLLSLVRQDLDPGKFEVIVVSNLEEAHSSTGLESLNLRWLCAGGIGVNRARNRGWKEARGPVILFLDDDVELDRPDLLTTHLEFHRDNPDSAAFGGSYGLPVSVNAPALAYHELAMDWLMRHLRPDGSCPYLLGGHSSYKTGLRERGFLFDESIAFGGAETELNHRLYHAGEKLKLDPGLSVIHHVEIGAWRLMRKAFLQTRHARARKEKFGAPEVQPGGKVSPVCNEGGPLGRRLACELAKGAYRLSAKQGWKSLNRENSWRTRLVAFALGLKLPDQPPQNGRTQASIQLLKRPGGK